MSKSNSYSLTELISGALVLIIAIGFGAYALTRGATAGGSETYELQASFRSAEGIAVGTDVRMAGVKIGSVTDLNLNPTSFRADATVTVDHRIEVPDDSTIQIASEGLLGGNFVEIQPGGSPYSLEPGDNFTNTQGAISLLNLMMKFVSGGDE